MTKLAPIILPDGNVLNKDYLFTHGTDIRDDVYEAILAGMKRAYYDPLQEWAQLCSFLYDYSPSNQTLLAYQAAARGIQPRFYASYKRWEAIGQRLYYTFAIHLTKGVQHGFLHSLSTSIHYIRASSRRRNALCRLVGNSA